MSIGAMDTAQEMQARANQVAGESSEPPDAQPPGVICSIPIDYMMNGEPPEDKELRLLRAREAGQAVRRFIISVEQAARSRAAATLARPPENHPTGSLLDGPEPDLRLVPIVGYAAAVTLAESGYEPIETNALQEMKNCIDMQQDELRILRNQRDHANQHMRRMAVRLGKLNSAIDTAYKCLEAAGLQKRVSK